MVAVLAALGPAERTAGSAGGTPASGLPDVRSWAPAATAAIRPGVRTTTRGGGVCTAGFVFTADDRVFLGQAAHCGGTGDDDTDTDGCRSATVALGTPVVIAGADGRTYTGTLAYSSWVAMRADGETDPATCAADDFALVALDPADAREVNPSLPIFGGPTGLDTTGLRAGEPVFGYGSRSARPGAGRHPGPGPHVGTSASDDRGAPVHEIYGIRPWVAGDSGSGVLASDGAAVGQLITLHLAPQPVSAGVTDLAQALDQVNAMGGLGEVELALGTEPFDPAPPGVALTELATPAGPPLRPDHPGT